MKREIKFRGINSKGEWVYGDLFRNRGETFIAPDGIANPLATAEDFQVDPETVGQFTGIKDKDYKDIYEGDVVTSQDKNRRDSHEDKTWESEIIYMNTNRIRGFGYHARIGGVLYHQWIPLCSEDHSGFKIIGNIHDNPELLKNK